MCTNGISNLTKQRHSTFVCARGFSIVMAAGRVRRLAAQLEARPVAGMVETSACEAPLKYETKACKESLHHSPARQLHPFLHTSPSPISAATASCRSPSSPVPPLASVPHSRGAWLNAAAVWHGPPVPSDYCSRTPLPFDPHLTQALHVSTTEVINFSKSADDAAKVAEAR